MKLNYFARQSTLIEWNWINLQDNQLEWNLKLIHLQDNQLDLIQFVPFDGIEFNSIARQFTWLNSIHSISWNWIEYLALRVAGQQVPLPLLPLPLLLPRDFVISWVMVTPASRLSPSPSRSCWLFFFSSQWNSSTSSGNRLKWRQNDIKMTSKNSI